MSGGNLAIKATAEEIGGNESEIEASVDGGEAKIAFGKREFLGALKTR